MQERQSSHVGSRGTQSSSVNTHKQTHRRASPMVNAFVYFCILSADHLQTSPASYNSKIDVVFQGTRIKHVPFFKIYSETVPVQLDRALRPSGPRLNCELPDLILVCIYPGKKPGVVWPRCSYDEPSSCFSTRGKNSTSPNKQYTMFSVKKDDQP